MQFSIIMPVYQSEKTLEKAVESILCQSFGDFELILVDDGSKDRSGALCDSFARQDTRVQVIHKKNEGVLKARRDGLFKSSGSYIYNLDSDDYVDSGLLEELAQVIRIHAPDVIAFGYQAEKDGKYLLSCRNGAKSGLYRGKDLEKLRKRLIFDPGRKAFNYGSIIYSFCTKCIRREFLLQQFTGLPTDIRKGEDLFITAHLFCHCTSAFLSDSCPYHYGIFENSMMRSFRENEMENNKQVYRYLRERVPELPKNNIGVWLFYMALQYALDASGAAAGEAEFVSGMEKHFDRELTKLLSSVWIPLPRPRFIRMIILLRHRKYGALYRYFQKNSIQGV